MIKKINELKSEYSKRLGRKEQLESDISNMKEELENKKELYNNLNAVNTLLTSTSNKAREVAKMKLESIVTNALRFIYEDDIEFKIELDIQRGVPSCEFYVKTFTNGVETIQKPTEACGGGYVDIISTALRFAYIEALENPKIGNAILLDEPGKQIDENASVKFAEFVKDLGETFDRQIIMITHNNNVMNVADKTFVVDQSNGVSKITTI